MRTAVIDIGTNSVKLTVADVGGEVIIVDEKSRITRLGKNVDSSGSLNSEAIQRTLVAIGDFVAEAQELGAEKISAAGTSALRDASNGQELLSAARSSYGLDIEIISGEREAALGYKAVTGDARIVSKIFETLLVFDIGGGSTELIAGTPNGIQQHVSLNIGAVRLTERYIKSDPPTDAEFLAATADASKEIATFTDGKSVISLACGVGGTAVTLAAITLSTRDVHGKVVEMDGLLKTVTHLRSLTLEQRRTVEFLEPERADVIVAGAAILLAVLKAFNQSSYKVSLRGMRFGLLLEQAVT